MDEPGDAEKSLQHFQQSMTLRNKLGLKRFLAYKRFRGLGLRAIGVKGLGLAVKGLGLSIEA